MFADILHIWRPFLQPQAGEELPEFVVVYVTNIPKIFIEELFAVLGV
jgi:hypothetical protein